LIDIALAAEFDIFFALYTTSLMAISCADFGFWLKAALFKIMTITRHADAEFYVG